MDARLTPPLSIVVPCLNESAGIRDALIALQPLRARGCEVIVVDGGSHDATVALARPHADIVIESGSGRALQMNAGAKRAQADVLLFLHADTRLPTDADRLIAAGLARSGATWGRFDISIAGSHPLLGAVSLLMNARSRITHIATGDQAIFVTRAAFAATGGFPEMPLMEDIELCARLKRTSRPACLRARVITSGRRWERNGVVRTILLMWRLRFQYWRGADPAALALRYDAAN